jgi:hypothetical protein
MREISDRNILDDFCIRFCGIVDRHVKYIIVSGFVAISSGRLRGTEDIDMIIESMDKDSFIRLHEALASGGFECIQSDNPEEIFDYLIDRTSVRYTLNGKPVPEMELKFAKDELDRYQIKTRQQLPLTGLQVWFSSINMNIAFKEHYLKSPKDMEDAKHLRTVYSEMVDEKEIARIALLIKRLRL